jgi:hypothetical protein
MRPPTHHPEDAVVFKRGKLADLLKAAGANEAGNDGKKNLD